MSALYWHDFDCTPTSRAIEHETVVHSHHDSDRAACLVFIDWRHAWPTGTTPPHGQRYRCIRGPRGLVRGVMGDDGRRMWFP